MGESKRRPIAGYYNVAIFASSLKSWVLGALRASSEPGESSLGRQPWAGTPSPARSGRRAREARDEPPPHPRGRQGPLAGAEDERLEQRLLGPSGELGRGEIQRDEVRPGADLDRSGAHAQRARAAERRGPEQAP